MKTVSVKVASAVIASLGLAAGAVGMVGAQTGSIGSTGEDSENTVLVNNDENRDVTKNADVTAENNNPQTAVSGDATVEDGDDEGTAASGEAANASTFTGGVTVGQGGSGAASLTSGGSGAVAGTITGETGEDSANHVEVNNNVQHTNEHNATVNVTNNNSQYAESGAAVVTGGEDGGNATSGVARNTSNSTFTIGVTQ